jgi:tetratricopeptide (TPR) repeat protein
MKRTWIKSLVMMWGLMISASLFAQAARTAQSVAPADSLLAEARTAMDNYDYDRVLDLLPADCTDADCLTVRARALGALNRTAEALATWQALSAQDSLRTQPWVEQAECCKRLGKLSQAAALYQRASELQPHNTYFRQQHIRVLLAASQYEAARDACHEWLQCDTLSPTGYKLLGQTYEAMQDYVRAFASYNKAYNRDATDPQVVASIAGLFNDNQQYPNAAYVSEVFRRQVDSTDVSVNRQYAKALFMQKQYHPAVLCYEDLLRQGDNSFTTLYYLGLSQYSNREYAPSYATLLTAHQLNPNDVNVLYHLGRAASKSHRPDEAVDYIEEAIALSTPSDSLMARLYGGLADCYGIPSHWQERVEAFKMRYKYGRQETTLYAIASLYEQMNHPDEALAYFQKFTAELDRSQAHIQNPDAAQRTKLHSLYEDAALRIKRLKAEAFFREGKKE